MNRQRKIFIAIACLAFAALACQAVTGGGWLTATSTPSPRVLLSDDFSTERWGRGTDSDSAVQYVDRALQIIVYTDNFFVWSTPNGQTYQDVHLEVKVTDNGTDPDTAFGLICNKQPTINSFHFLLMKPNGEYVIGRATDGQSDVFLTNNGSWTISEKITRNAGTYHVGADCGNGTLTLYVDGQQIDSISDPSYTSGEVALLVGSAVEATSTNVTFDDFLMTELP